MSPERVILVPGVGFGGTELLPLSLRLRRYGYRTAIFRHFTGWPSLEESARALWIESSRHPEETIHFVGHSMGGLVVLRMLADHPWDRPGRVLTLGTPHRGLRAARRLSRIPGGRTLLGRTLHEAADAEPIAFAAHRELGTLAGNRDLLVGRVIAGEASDSLIAVAETHHPDSRDHLVVPETHVTMLLTKRVASRVDHFLRQGRFAA